MICFDADINIATEPVVDAAVEPKEEEAKAAEPTEEEARAAEEVKPEPKKNNRHSIFSRFGKREEEKKEKEVEAPAAETEGEAKAVTETPVIETPTAEKTPSSPKSDLLSFFGKRDKSPAPKAAVVEDKAEEPTLAAAVEEPVVEASNDVIVTPPTEEAETPVVAAPKEKRKSSFFGFGKEKKVEEKKSEDVRSDSEDAEIIAPKPSTSPVPKSFLGGLKRKVSKAGKAAEKPEAKEVVTPAAVPEEEETAITLLPETAEPVKTEPETTTSTEAAPAIGDVVAEAVTAGKPVQATA